MSGESEAERGEAIFEFAGRLGRSFGGEARERVWVELEERGGVQIDPRAWARIRLDEEIKAKSALKGADRRGGTEEEDRLSEDLREYVIWVKQTVDWPLVAILGATGEYLTGDGVSVGERWRELADVVDNLGEGNNHIYFSMGGVSCVMFKCCISGSCVYVFLVTSRVFDPGEIGQLCSRLLEIFERRSSVSKGCDEVEKSDQDVGSVVQMTSADGMWDSTVKKV